jgi:pilus assembly protein Flp/PilA
MKTDGINQLSRAFCIFKTGKIQMLRQISVLVSALTSDKRAVTAIEYALIAALIAVAIIGAVVSLGLNASNTFNSVSSEL